MLKIKTISQRVASKITEAGIFWLGLFTFSRPVFAQTTPEGSVPSDVGSGVDVAAPEDAPSDLETVFTSVVNTVLFIVGAVAVLMLIVGGVRYVISSGNQEQVTAAKNTIVYALVGLIIAILAFAIINFITGRLFE